MRISFALITLATFALGGCATGSTDTEDAETSASETSEQAEQQVATSDDEPSAATADATAEPETEEDEDTNAKTSSETTWPADDIPPQAAPVHQMLEAIYAPDPELFRAAFTHEVQASMKDYGVEKAMKAWRDGMDEMLGGGEIEPGSIDYGYEGDADSGRVRVEYDGDKVGNIRVARTTSGWKIAEK